jgi:hypothetical protein
MKTDLITTQVCMTINIQNVYYLPELCEWVNEQEFDLVHFNMLHDPNTMCISKMTTQAQKLVIDRLSTYPFTVKHKVEISKIIQFIQNGSKAVMVLNFCVKCKLQMNIENKVS